MPFTTEQFFSVFARYNEAFWPAPIVLTALAIAGVLLFRHARAESGRAIAALLAVLWTWTAVAYHWMFFSAINPAAWLFGALSLLGAASFLWVGVLRNGWRPNAAGHRAALGWLLVVLALVVYPILGSAFGHRYPAVPTFGAPCPVTIYTLGVLLLAGAPRVLYVVPLLWAGIGSFAAIALSVPQDLGLLAAGLIGLWAGIMRAGRPVPARLAR